MSLFALVYSYTDDVDLVATHRPEHRAYLQGLFDKGQLLVAGPLGRPGPARGLLVLDVDSEDDVRRIAEVDPFTAHDVVIDYSVGSWTLSFGAERLAVPES